MVKQDLALRFASPKWVKKVSEAGHGEPKQSIRTYLAGRSWEEPLVEPLEARVLKLVELPSQPKDPEGFVLEQLADSAISDDEKERIKARWKVLNPGAAAPWENTGTEGG